MLGLRHPLAVHAEQAGVFANRREQAAALPLELDAQQVQHVAARQDVVEVVRDLDAESFDARRHQRRRPADDHVGAELLQPVNVAAGDAAVGDVADEADGQPVDSARAAGGW